MTSSALRPSQIKRPPIWECGVSALICVVISVIYLASYIPHTPNTIPAWTLLALGTALVLAQLVLLGSIDNFSRRDLHQVGAYSLAAYIVIGGMIEYVFVKNHTHGTELGLLTWGLALFVIDVPLILSFSVARYQSPSSA